MPHSRHVIGPPGTGKTHWIKGEVPKSVERHGIKKVAVCSLTKAAATEAAERVDLPEQQVGTLHSFCYRETCGNSDTIFSTDKDAIKAWNEECGSREWMVRGDPDDHPMFQRYGKFKSMMVEPMTDSDRSFAARYDTFKRDNGIIDFNDMLVRGLELERMPGFPSSLYIDEAQDMSRLEAAVLRNWARHMDEITIVGDPYQNLYEFRGSDSAAMIPTHDIIDNAIILSQSYRVPRAVHALADKTIQKMPGYIPVEYHPRDADGYHNKCDASAVVSRAIEQADSGESVMILAPANYMLDQYIKQLRAKGAPFHNPFKLRNGAWNPLRPGGIADKARAFMTMQYSDRWTPWELKQWTSGVTPSKLWIRGKGAYAKRAIDEMIHDKDMLPSQQDDMMYALLTECVLPDVLPRVLEGDLQWFTDHAKGDASVAYLTRIIDSGRFMQKEPRIVVGTIHSVKGGQADHVYLSQDLSLKQYENRTKDAAAHARMFYVGVTRARQGVTVIKPTGSRLYKL